MRNSGIVIIVALALMLSVSATGQPDRLIDLSVEPERSPVTNSLADAARRHDFPTFDSMYRTAVSRHSVAAFDELHALWTWAMTDPIGAFYGQQRYERYARMFPGYARFIEEYRIVDSKGNSFFPTAETRRFLLERALSGTPVVAPEPVTRVAVAGPARDLVESRNTEPAIVPVRVAAVPVVAKIESTKLGNGPAEAGPYIARPEVTVVEAAKTSQSDVGAGFSRPVSTRPDIPIRSIPHRPGLGRGIFLIIAGLLGVGMLTMLLQTPATHS